VAMSGYLKNLKVRTDRHRHHKAPARSRRETKNRKSFSSTTIYVSKTQHYTIHIFPNPNDPKNNSITIPYCSVPYPNPGVSCVVRSVISCAHEKCTQNKKITNVCHTHNPAMQITRSKITIEY
jgi:hypothetical protein